MTEPIIQALTYAAPLLIALAYLWHRNARLSRKLANLRDTAWVRNSKGRLERYATADAETRARAETE
jgi:hypothetical protein